MNKNLLVVLIALLGIGTGHAQTTGKTEDKTFTFVSMENPPQFPGGMAAFYKFLSEHIKYPEEAKKANIQGNVFLTFVIEKDGSVSDIKTIRGLGAGTDEEAIRVLKLSPKWIPGKQNGKLVRVSYSLPIKFANSKVK